MSRLWEGREVAVAAGLNAVGLALIVFAHGQAADRLTLSAQVAPLNLAVSGLIVAGAANAFFLVLGRQRVRVRLLHVRRALQPDDAPGSLASAQDPDADVVVSGRARRYRHRPGCQLVAGKDTEPARADGVEVCGVCHP